MSGTLDAGALLRSAGSSVCVGAHYPVPALFAVCLLSVEGSNELYKNGMVPLKFGLAWVKGIEISQRL